MSTAHPLHVLMAACRHDGHALCYNDLVELEKAVFATPAAHWRLDGEGDPHGSAYDIERAALPLGWLSDDELANGVFMNYNAPLDVQGILEKRKHSPIAWVTAAKDRIRWLSRRLQNLRAHLSASFSAEETVQNTLIEAAAALKSVDPDKAQGLLDLVEAMKAGVVTHRWREPETRRAAFEKIVEREAGAGALKRWPNERGECYENPRVDDYYTGWLWANRDSAQVAAVAREFIEKHRVHDEGVCEDRVYENAPGLVEALGNIVGFYKYPE